jgi:PAS domain S-box-containing protein
VGDIRFGPVFDRVKNAENRAEEIFSLSDDDVIAALGGATREQDLLLVNVLATEAQNRAHRATTITASLGEGVIALDRYWRVTLQNPAAERILGWKDAEVVGKDLHGLIHPFCDEPDVCHLGKLPPPEFFYQNDDALVLRKDGRTVRVAYTVTPMSRRGEVDGGVVVLRDASERKRQEEKASEKQDQLATILQTIAEGVLTMDLTGRMTYANRAAERILGRAARDICERTYFDPVWSFQQPDGGILSVTDLPFRKVIETGHAVLDAKLVVQRGDGSTVLLNVSSMPLPDANGTVFAILASFLEATPRA